MEKSNSIVIRAINLVKSEFIRNKIVNEDTIRNLLELDLAFDNLNGPIFKVIVKLVFKTYLKEEGVQSAEIIMEGIFEIDGEKPSFFDEFCVVNAPAIIYPYIREHLASLTNKSGNMSIYLPTFNFVAFGKDYLKKQKEKIEELSSKKEEQPNKGE